MDTQIPMDFANSLNVNYIAGLFDGEGSVSIGRTSTPGEKLKRGRPGYFYEKYFLQVSIVNTYRPVLDLIHALYGGGVNRTSAVVGRKECFVWKVGGKNALPFLEDMLPRVHIKREQIGLALKFISLPRTWQVEERKRLYAAMSALNGRRNSHRRAMVTPESLTRLRHRQISIWDDGVSISEPASSED